ncbi:MAG TPA: 4Fe-4S binding protein [Dehalococcoidales bacterium]|nr:4Fe-4S binding protein [Dehalococcoidales bacterium]
MNSEHLRKIIRIDEEKCNGCGLCVPFCAEGALQIVNGKAKLVSEQYCDGLGACLGECPQGALIIEKRAAEEFDEEAVAHHLNSGPQEQELPCGCPSANVARFQQPTSEIPASTGAVMSTLTHWPVQLTLVPPSAPFLKSADILLAADCVPFAYADFHREFLQNRALLVACPKLDDFGAHLNKLIAILQQAEPRSITVVHMEVPCCSGLVSMARKAIEDSGSDIPLYDVTVGTRGSILSRHDPVPSASA